MYAMSAGCPAAVPCSTAFRTSSTSSTRPQPPTSASGSANAISPPPPGCSRFRPVCAGSSTATLRRLSWTRRSRYDFWRLSGASYGGLEFELVVALLDLIHDGTRDLVDDPHGRVH